MTVYEVEVTARVTVEMTADSPDDARAWAGWVYPLGWITPDHVRIIRKGDVSADTVTVREQVAS